jgi:hypothetical protein
MDSEVGIPIEFVSAAVDKTKECHKTFDNPAEPQSFRKLIEAAISGREPKYKYGFLSFDALHRLILLNHQHKLARRVRDVVRYGINDKEQLRRIDEDLHAYRMWENLCDFYELVC